MLLSEMKSVRFSKRNIIRFGEWTNLEKCDKVKVFSVLFVFRTIVKFHGNRPEFWMNAFPPIFEIVVENNDMVGPTLG